MNELYVIHGKLITMAEGADWTKDYDYEDGYIIIKDGKIFQVGPMCELGEIPKGAACIDAAGAIVTPGLVDAHSHIGLWEDSLSFEGDDGNEDTDPITPQLRVIDGINCRDRAFSETLRAGITTVVVSPGSANPIGGQLAAMKTYRQDHRDQFILAPAGIKMAFGENPKTSYHERNQTPITRMGTAALIREALFKAKDYKEQKDRYHKNPEEEERPEWDFKSEALMAVFDGLPVYAHAHRLDDMETALRIAKEFGLDLILVHGTEAHLEPDRFQQENVPILVGPVLTDRSKPELANQSEDAVQQLWGKVPLAVVTDHPETPEKFLMLSLAAASQGKMTRREMLALVTCGPAAICGLKQVGAIAQGMDGDIVVWDGDLKMAGVRPSYVIGGGNVLYGKDPVFKDEK